MLKAVLEELFTIQGVNAAALVGRDGFVIEIVKLNSVDTDALGALTSSALSFFDKSGMGMGGLKQLVLEHRDGAIIITPITKDEFLVLLSEVQASTGRLAYIVSQATGRVASAM